MILIFGGTTEGRIAVDVCEQAGKPFYYATKSDQQQVDLHHGQRLTGAMTAADIKQFCSLHDIRCIVDAAHPFAENLHRAVAETELPVIRLERSFAADKPGVIYCKDYVEAVQRLLNEPARLLLALSGANTIVKLKDYWQQYTTRFRILDREDSRALAKAADYPLSHLVYYNKDICQSHVLPSIEEEKRMMQQVGCDAIITKDSGETGGFDTKVEAALQLGLRVFVVRRPQLPQHWTCVTGRHGLRRAIEQLIPSFFPLHTGFTTGACATAACKAALLCLLHDEAIEEVPFSLPDGEVMHIPVDVAGIIGPDEAYACVTKDISDDPDVTKGCHIRVDVKLTDSPDIIFLQGEGVGRVTLPGLGIPVGGPAINATPRLMMESEIRRLTDNGCRITVSVEGGAELARQTFNPKVGVVDGISIIGTSGIVSPLSHEAFVQSIRREMEVAHAIGCEAIGLASGKRGEDALHAREPSLRVIHYGNFIGAALQMASELGLKRVELGIMIGKAVKLAEGNLDTHSHKVTMNKEFLKQVMHDCGIHEDEIIDGITMARELWSLMPPCFFERLRMLCMQHCRTVFPSGELNIHLICDIPQS